MSGPTECAPDRARRHHRTARRRRGSTPSYHGGGTGAGGTGLRPVPPAAPQRFRCILTEHTYLARKLGTLERKYDAQFKVVFDAIRKLMEPPPAIAKRRIGFAR